MRKVAMAIILSLVLTIAFFGGWNKGYDVGYESGLSDVMLGFVNPVNYFMKKFHVGKFKNDRRS